MVKRKSLIFLVLFAVLIVSVIFLFIRRDRDIIIIKKNLDEISSLLEKQGQETLFVSLSKMQKLASFFFDDCQINVGSPVPHIAGKNELMATASQMRQLANNIDIKLSEISIDLEGNTSARTTFVAAASVSGSVLEKEEIYPRQLDITWEKAERKWKIKKVEIINVLH